MVAISLVPNREAAVAEEPRDRPLDLPTVPAEALAGLDAGTGDPGGEPAITEPAQVFRGVVRLIGPDLRWSPPARAAP